MTTGAGMEPRQIMAKIQKSLLINEDLVRLLEAHAKRTGASFTRQVTAAVIQYLFSDPQGPRPRWMEVAVELDDAHITVDGIIDECAAYANMEWSVINDEDQQTGKAGERARSSAFAQIAEWRAKVHNEWEHMQARAEKDPVDKVTAFWNAADAAHLESELGAYKAREASAEKQKRRNQQ